MVREIKIRVLLKKKENNMCKDIQGSEDSLEENSKFSNGFRTSGV